MTHGSSVSILLPIPFLRRRLPRRLPVALAAAPRAGLGDLALVAPLFALKFAVALEARALELARGERRLHRAAGLAAVAAGFVFAVRRQRRDVVEHIGDAT